LITTVQLLSIRKKIWTVQDTRDAIELTGTP
jgi:hypothetical protein